MDLTLINRSDKLKIYFDASENEAVVSDWVGHSTAVLNVKELELDFTHSRKILVLSYDLMENNCLRIMKLVYCELHLPIDSNGLRNLRELTLQDTRARPEMMEALFVNCLSLRALTLIKCRAIFSLEASGQVLQTFVVKNCSDVHSVALNSPCLRTFHYHGKITEFNFYCRLPCLSDVILEIAHPRTFQLLYNGKYVMKSLAFVKTLTVTSTILEGLTIKFQDQESKDSEFCLRKVKEFHLLVASKSFLNPYDVIIFLRKCPYIERVFINLEKNAFVHSFYWGYHVKEYWNKCQIIFPFLKYVKIIGFTLKELPMSMVRYFLKNATNLHCLVLVKARFHYFPEYYNPEHLRFGINSNARIDIYEYQKDMSIIMPEHMSNV